MTTTTPSNTPTTTGPYRQTIATRWADNDMYGHLNNTIYYQAMDTAINTWFMSQTGLDPLHDDVIGFCVSSSCQFRAAAGFPEELVVELRSVRIGTTSLAWSPRILRSSDDSLLADGTFVTVFVDSVNRRPVPVPERIRTALEAAFELVPASH